MPVLPKSLILSSSERAEVQRHICELDRFTKLDQLVTIRGTMMENEAALSVIIAGLLLKGGQKLDQAAADLFTEDYLDALEDLPAWAVREALRKWNRGESVQLDPKRSHDFNWPPKPAILRRLAEHELASVKGRIYGLQKLIDAVPLIEFSEEYCQTMINRLAALLRPGLSGDGLP
jgi:hypothetical protein